MFRESKYAAVASDRRWSFLAVNVFVCGMGAVLMFARLSASGWNVVTAGLYLIFLVLEAQLVYGFTLAVTGWWVLRKGDALRIGQTLPPEDVPEPLPPTAMVMPIFNEDVGRVFAGLRVMYESLRATGHGEAFDWFILSDSNDLNIWVAEEQAWFELCQRVQGFGRIFYRKRRLNLHHKSGNVADFCRRWGAKYECLIVLDADSVMTGRACVRMASLMAANPQAGIIQTCSRLVLGQTLFQRINQFAGRVYGPLFVAGANFWQLENANYYGHNAIIRLKPFMEFCAMPELPPSGRLGRRILSHDTVEAALIRRAGFQVWMDYDLEGSYEESPPDLPASLLRDRRWCHGNLQHGWFLLASGLTLPSRLNILNGIMAYASSPLWLLFLLFSPMLFFMGHQFANNSLLFVGAMVLLFAPKLLGAGRELSAAPRPTARAGFRLLAGVFAETIYSMLLAPILMLFHTRFIWSSFFGRTVAWGRQKRSDSTVPTWRECCEVHGINTVLALAAAVLVAWLLPAMWPWSLMVLVGPVLAIPFSRLLASSTLGWRSRRRGWFLIPEEVRPPKELAALQAWAESVAGRPPGDAGAEDFGFMRTVLDPHLNGIHVSLLRERRQMSLHKRRHLTALSEQVLRDGAAALPPREKRVLFWDADAMLALHQKLWSTPAAAWHRSWQAAFQDYIGSLPQDQSGVETELVAGRAH